MTETNDEPTFESMTLQEQNRALQNALDYARQDRDMYRDSYFETNRELKMVKQWLEQAETRLAEYRQDAQAKQPPPEQSIEL